MSYDFDTSIINVAEDFYAAYLRCREGKNIFDNGHGTIRSDVVNVPAIVNGTFAIELYLKSLSHGGGEELRRMKHSIRKLFSTLDSDYQLRIRSEVEKELPSNYTFEKGLKIINNSFTFWRYIHEKPDFGYGLNVTLIVLSPFLEVIRRIAREQQ